VIAILSAGVAVASTALAYYGNWKVTAFTNDLDQLKQKEVRREEKELAISKFKEPLIRAAYDLQSRLYNILELEFVRTYLVKGDERSRAYVVNNTAYLVAQYFAWTEIIRLEIQFIDLHDEGETRQLAEHQDGITSIWQRDDLVLFRVFSGEQRAIGEVMIRRDERGLGCIGYSEFLRMTTTSPDPFIEQVCRDVQMLAEELPTARPRLIELQHALIDLLAFLDPLFLRFPEKRRTKVGR